MNDTGVIGPARGSRTPTGHPAFGVTARGPSYEASAGWIWWLGSESNRLRNGLQPFALPVSYTSHGWPGGSRTRTLSLLRGTRLPFRHGPEIGATGRIRTSTHRSGPAPQAGASTVSPRWHWQVWPESNRQLQVLETSAAPRLTLVGPPERLKLSTLWFEARCSIH